MSDLAMGTKPLDDITINEWSNWHWTDVTTFRDERRMYLRGAQRTPQEAIEACKEFDAYKMAVNQAWTSDIALLTELKQAVEDAPIWP